MSKIAPCIWYATEAEEAANFYVSLLPNSRVVHVQMSPADSPGNKAGSVLVVYFELAGQSFMGLNGGTQPEFTHSISFSIDCADQAEVDRLWDALVANGGEPVACGWLKDRYGVSWQIIPAALPKLLADPDPARAKRAMEAMLDMVKIDVAAIEAAADGRAAA